MQDQKVANFDSRKSDFGQILVKFTRWSLAISHFFSLLKWSWNQVVFECRLPQSCVLIDRDRPVRITGFQNGKQFCGIEMEDTSDWHGLNYEADVL